MAAWQRARGPALCSWTWTLARCDRPCVVSVMLAVFAYTEVLTACGRQATVYVYELLNNDVKVEKLEFVKAAA